MTTAQGVLIACVLIGAFSLYMLPSIVSASRGAPGTAGTTVLNLFFGWSALGWCIAMARALRDLPEAPHFCPAQVAPQVVFVAIQHPQTSSSHVVNASSYLAGR